MRTEIGREFGGGQPGSGAPAGRSPWPEIAPSHVIEFAESPGITGAVVAPDGSVAYAQLRVEAVDLWRVGTRYWPEGLGVVLGLVAVAVLVATWLVARRPRRKGRPYCRRCNYDLSEHASRAGPREPWRSGAGVRCPECGMGLSGRAVVTGRGLARRCAAAWAVLGAAGLVYGGMFALGMSRADARLQWFTLPSAPVAGLARARGIGWLVREIEVVNRIAVVDVATGRRLEDLWQGGWHSAQAPALTRDGRYLVVADGRGGVIAIRTATGRVARRLAVNLGDSPLPLGMPAAQFAGDGHVAYITALDAERGRTVLVAWDLATGESGVVAETGVYRDDTRPAPFQVSGRWFSVAEVGGRVLAVSMPGFSEWYHTRDVGAPEFEVHDCGTGERRGLGHAMTSGTRASVLSGRGTLVELPACIDVTSGERAVARQSMDDRLVYMTVHSVGIDATQRLAVFSSHRRIDVLDLERNALASRLTHPEEWIGLKISAETCERWVAAVGFRSTGGVRGPFTHALLLYDLAPMRSRLAVVDADRAARAAREGDGAGEGAGAR
jgi:hypothetical protein